MTTRLLYLVSHPIQYQAPLLRRIAREPGIALTVLFESDFSSRTYHDTGFGADVTWDVPLRNGYESRLIADVDLVREMRAADAIWLHGWASRTMHLALALAGRVGRPVLMRGENWSGAMPDGPPAIAWIKRLYLGRIFRRCSAFLAVGSRNRAYYHEHGIAPHRVFDMPYAVDNDFFRERATPDAALAVKARHGIAPGRKVLLYAGKLAARKHPDHLLTAWRSAAWRDGVRPVLVFVGDGELRASLSRVDDPDVLFVGFRNQTELPGYYAAADLFALPAAREPWGLAINEAMACGTGILTTDQVGAAYDLVNDETGRVVKAGDVEALTHALPDLMDRSETIGKAARMRIGAWSFEQDVTGLKAALAAVR